MKIRTMNVKWNWNSSTEIHTTPVQIKGWSSEAEIKIQIAEAVTGNPADMQYISIRHGR